MDTAYGAESLDEFASEAWSNETFRGKLASINPKGEKITALQRFLNIVGNLFRKMMGMETKRIETALDAADRVIESIIAPNPGMQDAPLLYSATVDPKNPKLAAWIDSAVDVMEKAGLPANYADKVHTFLKNTTSSTVRGIYLAGLDRKSTRLNSSHVSESRMPSSA